MCLHCLGSVLAWEGAFRGVGVLEGEDAAIIFHGQIRPDSWGLLIGLDEGLPGDDGGASEVDIFNKTIQRRPLPLQIDKWYNP